MAAAPIRVLVVDDSAVIRQRIRDYLADEPGIEVAGMASDGAKGLELFDSARPDVVTLDVRMPNMDGLATLDAMLLRRPVPVIMVSALTQLGASITLEALERGAMDYVAKPDSGAEVESSLRDDLARKIRAVAGIDVKRILQIRHQRKKIREERVPRPKEELSSVAADHLADKCVAIGVSTGGPSALSILLESLRPPMPPIVIVQHMPPHFTRPLAWRLDNLSRLSVREAADGDLLRPNQVLIAPGGHHLELVRQGSLTKVRVFDAPPVSSHKPSVDVMMRSAAAIYGPRVVGMIMTGMGRDGADGCGAIRAGGGFVLGQDENTSEVYGMNKVAFLEGSVDRQFALDDAAVILMRQIQRRWPTGVPVMVQ
jgi:two-component system chemotaxis response regulator CheB